MRAKRTRHSSAAIARTLSLFFAVRGLLRTALAQGKRLDPYAWLQLEALKFIADAGAPRMGDLAAHLSITAPSATSLVRTLVRGGFVARRADERDRRVERLLLTARGTAKLARAIARGTELLAPVFSPLSARELAAFARMLERLKEGAGK